MNYFETIDTPEKAYFLGFLAADGCVSGNRVSFHLHTKDILTLEAFREEIGASKKVTNYVQVANDKVKFGCRFEVGSKKMVKDLAALGLGERKSLTQPAFIKQLPKELQSCALLGLSDGDGSWYQKERSRAPSWNLMATMPVIQEVIEISGITPGAISDRSAPVYQLRIYQREQTEKMFRYMYQTLPNHFLWRKYKFGLAAFGA